MHKSTTLNWIEQAEAARVLSDAAFDDNRQTFSRNSAADAVNEWRARMRDWLMPAQSFGWPECQLQPVRIRAPRPRSADDDHNFGCDW